MVDRPKLTAGQASALWCLLLAKKARALARSGRRTNYVRNQPHSFQVHARAAARLSELGLARSSFVRDGMGGWETRWAPSRIAARVWGSMTMHERYGLGAMLVDPIEGAR